MIYTADFLVSPGKNPIRQGAMRIQGQRIVQVGNRDEIKAHPGEEVYELNDALLMPGLINAHCHLELGMMRGVLSGEQSFALWVSRLRKFLLSALPADYANATQLGALECLKNGITTVVDVGNTGEPFGVLQQIPIRSFPHLELIGLDPAVAESRLCEAKSKITNLSAFPSLMRPSLAAHAPFSCSIELLQILQNDLAAASSFFTMHLAESKEEQLLFLEGRGPLWEFCRRIFPAMQCPAETPVKYLQRNNLLPSQALWVHGNLLQAEDFEILAQTKSTLVHCPKSHAFFHHPRFAYTEAVAAGLNICLGTDSLASNDSLSIFDEMAEFKRVYPQVTCQEIFKMATVNGANALGYSDLGRLEVGALADFIAIHFKHDEACILEDEIVCEAHEVSLVVVNGEAVIQ